MDFNKKIELIDYKNNKGRGLIAKETIFSGIIYVLFNQVKY